MNTVRPTGNGIITLSFLLAFILAGVPLAAGWAGFEPDWVAMVLIYWCMALPHRIDELGLAGGTAGGRGPGGAAGTTRAGLRGGRLSDLANLPAHPGFFAVAAGVQRVVVPVDRTGAGVLDQRRDRLSAPRWLVSGSSAMGGMAAWPLLFVVLRDTRRYFQIT